MFLVFCDWWWKLEYEVKLLRSDLRTKVSRIYGANHEHLNSTLHTAKRFKFALALLPPSQLYFTYILYLSNIFFSSSCSFFSYHFFFNLLIMHAPSLESNTTCCELVGNAGHAPIRLLSLHFLYIVFLRLYIVLSLALLLL